MALGTLGTLPVSLGGGGTWALKAYPLPIGHFLVSFVTSWLPGYILSGCNLSIWGREINYVSGA